MGFFSDAYTLVIGYLVPALLILGIVVFIHELGHFLVARWFGKEVEVFSIGFGPEIAGFADGKGTRWRIAAIPLGGYVRFAGDENAASFPDEAELSAIPPEKRGSILHLAPVWQRALVVAAGPAANFLLALLIFAGVFLVQGRAVVTPRVSAVVEGSAAEAAGLQAGDLILQIDGRDIRGFGDIQRIIALSSDRSVSIVVDRSGETLTFQATPERQERPDGFGGTQRIGILGVQSINGEIDYLKFGPLAATGEAAREIKSIVGTSLRYLGRLVTGRESIEQLGGPLRVTHISGKVAENGGASGLLKLTAIISVSIGLINLFPIPILDGGHLVFYAIEAVRGRAVSPRVKDLSFRFGFTVIMLLFVVVFVNDALRLPILN